MSDALRPRRSVLYMPSSNERALEKAKSIPTDALIFDLEDAVAPDTKESARAVSPAAGSKLHDRLRWSIRAVQVAPAPGVALLRALAVIEAHRDRSFVCV